MNRMHARADSSTPTARTNLACIEAGAGAKLLARAVLRAPHAMVASACRANQRRGPGPVRRGCCHSCRGTRPVRAARAGWGHRRERTGPADVTGLALREVSDV